jgi:tetratricopeptide (TPR) repeat protein
MPTMMNTCVWIADRRILVLLDNASSVEQLRLLLPGTPSCAVLVTSRDSLSGLVAGHGARRLDLELLERDDALRLLRTLIGERVTAEPSAADDLVEHCARLPLALRIAAELAVRRGGTALSELVLELENRNRRLQLLQAGEDARTAVRTVFCWSYRQLPVDAARLFRRLGWYPGPDIDLHAAAALGQVDGAEAADQLDILCQAHLVHAAAGGRFGMHDLLRAYAAELAGQHDKAVDRKRALTSLLDYHAVTATRAMELYAPYERQGPLRVRRPPRSVAPLFPDSVSAQAWLDAERANLISAALYAADHGQSAHTARLSRILYRYLDLGVHYDDEKLLHTAAWRSVDPRSDIAAAGNYGVVLWRSGRYREALVYYEQNLFRARWYLGDRRTEARMLGNLGLVHWRIGNYQLALTQFEQAREVLQELNEPHLVAITLKNTGIVHRTLGSQLAALDHLWQALEVFRQIKARFEEANVLSEIGLACAELGDFRAAFDHQHEAAAIIRELGNPLFEGRVFNDLGITLRLSGSPRVAAEHHRRAIALTRELDDYEHARAHQQLARAYYELADPAAARRHWQRALALHSVLGTPETHDIATRLHALAKEYPPSDRG